MIDDLKTPVKYNEDRNNAGVDQYSKVVDAFVNFTTPHVVPTADVNISIDNTYVKPPEIPIVQKRS